MSDQSRKLKSLDECSAPTKWNGPRTAEGKQRIAQAQLKHGAYSKAGLEAKHAEAIQLRQLEDIAIVIGMITGPRTRGCKPRGYKAIRSMEAVKALVALKFRLKRSTLEFIQRQV
jgi:hypothetical protein